MQVWGGRHEPNLQLQSGDTRRERIAMGAETRKGEVSRPAEVESAAHKRGVEEVRSVGVQLQMQISGGVGGPVGLPDPDTGEVQFGLEVRQQRAEGGVCGCLQNQGVGRCVHVDVSFAETGSMTLLSDDPTRSISVGGGTVVM